MAETADTPAVLYIDLHLTHEVTTPQAYTVLRERQLKVRSPSHTFATMDHSTPTETAQVFGRVPMQNASARDQVAAAGAQLRRVWCGTPRHEQTRAAASCTSSAPSLA